MTELTPPAPPAAPPTRRLALAGRTLRQAAARGTIINAVFLTTLSALGLFRGFILARFLTRDDYGLWGVLMISLGTLLWLKQVGIGDKYIQQDDADQQLAFQKAFTLEAIFTGIFIVILAAAVPLIAVAYGRTDVIAPGLVLVAVMPAFILQAPLWIFYREMRFVRQRVLQAIDPIVSFVVAIALAIAGAGYWALVVGVLCGVWAAAIASVIACPFPLRFRYDRGTLRSYVSFSWPLVIASGAGIVIAQGSIIAGNNHLGLAGAGAITLAATISQFTDRVDTIISGTLYPAICAVRDQTALLFETFVKSNRLALMWAVPFGVGLALFAPDVVHFGIGEKWRPALILIQIFGISAAINHVGFNWDSYFRARGDTRPIAAVSVVSAVVFLVVAIPLLYVDGLRGLGIGIICHGTVGVIARGYYLRRLFSGFGLVRHILRSIAPTLPALAAILALRAVEPSGRSLVLALGEAVVYVAVTAAATLVLERDLLREAAGYVRARPSVA